MKNSEGDDRIPQRILIDGVEILLSPLTKLFGNIYETMTIPEQWKMAKITPVHKKGAKKWHLKLQASGKSVFRLKNLWEVNTAEDRGNPGFREGGYN